MVSEVETHLYTVSELTALIARALTRAFPRIRVEGEITNWRVSPAGHAYFKLKDDQALLSCVLFRSGLARVGFAPVEGMRVVARGAIDVYAPQGAYQLRVEAMEETGLGDAHLAFLRLKAKLEREGLFDPSRKRPIPPLPRCVGVVTSPTGAAIRDILNVLHRRFANVHVILAPVRVQGREAPAEITEAIRRLNRLGTPEVLIVGRGGGSAEDLAAFNDEGVARAVAASAIPVISAVGHETDFSIADFVADLRAPTPSAAAELVVQEQVTLQRQVRERAERLARAARGHLERAALRVDALASSYGLTQPLARIESLRERVRTLTGALARGARHALTEARGRWRPLEEALRHLDPERVLSRGYSVVTNEQGTIVREAGQVEVGETIQVRLHRGWLGADVTGVGAP